MRAFMTIAWLANNEKRLSQKSLWQLYIMCFTIINNFGAEVWWKNQKTEYKDLQKIQNQPLWKIAGAFRTTPSAAQKAEMGIVLVEVPLESLHRKYIIEI